jgi:hypothetical protein
VRPPNLTKGFPGSWQAFRGNPDHVARRRRLEKAAPYFKGFAGAKNSLPITIASKLQLDLAIQCSLDPEVRALSFVPWLKFRGEAVDIGMLVADFDGERFALDIVDDRPLRDLDTEGMHLLAIAERGIGLMEFDADDILEEPFASNCRHVWMHRATAPLPPMKEAILSELSRHAFITIRELSKATGFGGDITPAVYWLACADLVELELAQKLSDETLVSIRRPKLATPGEGVVGRT